MLRRYSTSLHHDDWCPCSSYILALTKNLTVHVIRQRCVTSKMMNKSTRKPLRHVELYREVVLSWSESIRALHNCKSLVYDLSSILEVNSSCMSMFTMSICSLFGPMYVFKPINLNVNSKLRTRLVNH
jgi:hypothetical protein